MEMKAWKIQIVGLARSVKHKKDATEPFDVGSTLNGKLVGLAGLEKPFERLVTDAANRDCKLTVYIAAVKWCVNHRFT